MLNKNYALEYLLAFLLLSFSQINCFSQSKLNCDSIHIRLKTIRIGLNKIGATDTKFKIDSLKKLNSNECKKAKIEFKVIEGRFKEFNKEYDEALNYYNKALEYCKNESYYQKTIAGYKCEIFGRKLENEKALEIANDALEIACPNSDYDCNRSNAVLLFKSGVRLEKLGRTAEAIETYVALEKEITANNLDEPILKAGLYNQLGAIYSGKFQNYSVSLEYYQKALKITPSDNKNKYFLYNNIAGCYSNLSNRDSTLFYFQKILDEATQSQFLKYAYNGLASLYSNEKNYKQAIKYFKAGLNNAILDKNKGSELIARINLGKMYFLSGQSEKANAYLTQVTNSELFTKLTRDRKYQAELYFNLAEVQVYNPKLSTNLFKVFQNYDTIAIQRRTAEINKSVSKYEKLILRDSLAKQMLLQENEAEKVKNYRLSTALLVMSLLFLLGLAYQFRRLFMGQKQKNQELVFRNSELEKVNEQLELKTRTLLTKPKVEGEKKEITIKIKDKAHFILMYKITYVQAEDDGVRVYYDDTSKWTDVSLKNFFQELDNSAFVQIGRGVVVNIKHIAWINTNTLKMKAGAELKIGRTYKPQIKKILES